MTTFEKIFFWLGILETAFFIFFAFGAWALNHEEKIRQKQEEPYRGKPSADPWPDWKDKK